MKKKRLEKALNNSFINYFSDLFVAVMVIAWIVVIIIMVVMAIYATVVISDTSMWCYVGELVAVPLTAGGALWMVKNCVNHAMYNRKGKETPYDFPKVDVEDIELESGEPEESEELG